MARSPAGLTSAASLPWNIGLTNVAEVPVPLMPVTSVTSDRRIRAANRGAKSRVW